jgi:hypothetical protein
VVNPNLQTIFRKGNHDMKTQVYTMTEVREAPVGSPLEMLEPGNMGEITDEQADWIRRHLKRSLTLSKWWGFSKKVRRGKLAIMRVAEAGDPDDVAINQQLVKGA